MNELAFSRIAIFGKDDEKALYDLLGTKDDRKKFDTQFKKAESNFKTAIVVDPAGAGLTGLNLVRLASLSDPNYFPRFSPVTDLRIDYYSNSAKKVKYRGSPIPV